MQRTFLLEDVYEIENDATFDSEMDVEVTQADVEVDDAGGVASLGEAGREGGCGGGFAHAAFAAGDADYAAAGRLGGVRCGVCGRVVDFGGVG
mmetsp:Transcript_15849/g.33144  ORF Transcript_15849/g.33144 Transcript_15849/m.33144 type:complete len:93 (+) Transcript_15849:648-926(+)